MVARFVHTQQPLEAGKRRKAVGRNCLLGLRERLSEFIGDVRRNAGMPQRFGAPDFVPGA